MTTRIGFEFEYATDNPRRKERKRLKELVSVSDFHKIKFKDDFSITGMSHGHEIVTPPLSVPAAKAMLAKIIEFLMHEDVYTNSSCGVHINVSTDLIKKINPYTFLKSYDYQAVLERWNRTRNIYCRSYNYYFNKVDKAVSTKYKANDWKDPYSVLSLPIEQVQELARAKFISALFDNKNTDKYNDKAVNEYNSKHTCINVEYAYSRGYYEFRLFGGKNYQFRYDDLLNEVDLILDTLSQLEGL